MGYRGNLHVWCAVKGVEKKKNIDAPDCPQFVRKKNRSILKHKTHYEIFDATIHKETLCEGK